MKHSSPRAVLGILAMQLLVAGAARAEGNPDLPVPAAPPVQSPLVRVERAADGRGVQVDIELHADAPLETVEHMVRDVARWPDWIPNMKQVAFVDLASQGHGFFARARAAVRSERVPTAIGPAAAAIAAATDAAAEEFVTLVLLPWPLRDVHEHLRLRRGIEEDGGVRIAWTQVRGDLRRNEGSFTLYAAGQRRTRVVYRANFQLGVWVPGFLVRAAGERGAPRFIWNMQRRAAIMAGPATAASGRSG